ncbi:MAG: S-isoprenylcysteine methyltransferase [Candidatus Thorarchaeota archaeon]|nr:MAG: S-isoprenylcysteine methyltransferase [Candidatus Thorarchaeota archaeon]
MSETSVPPKSAHLELRAFSTLFTFFLAIFLVLWGVSGTIYYWEAWIYILFFSVLETFMAHSLVRNEPELLGKRLTLREKDTIQQGLILFGGINYVLMYTIPAIDRRYEWSIMPVWVMIVGYILLGIGWTMTHKVFQINRWAGRAIQVQEGQKVISTGLYGIVRHPMYLGGWLISLGTPLVLGSYWGLIASITWLIMLILRLSNEEKMLIRDLPGYEDYCKKVKYHLIPGIY